VKEVKDQQTKSRIAGKLSSELRGRDRPVRTIKVKLKVLAQVLL
jgi:hypothetical protein